MFAALLKMLGMGGAAAGGSAMGGIKSIGSALPTAEQFFGSSMKSPGAGAGAGEGGFGFMDALGSAAGKMPAGGTGKNPHMRVDPMSALSQYRDMSQPNMNPMLSLMSSLQEQQAPNSPMQAPMHPLLLQMLKRAGVR